MKVYSISLHRLIYMDAVVKRIVCVCVSGAFLQHGVWPGTWRGPLWDACGLLSGLQSLLWHFLFLPDDGDLPHRREVQSGLQGAHTQRVSLPHHHSICSSTLLMFFHVIPAKTVHECNAHSFVESRAAHERSITATKNNKLNDINSNLIEWKYHQMSTNFLLLLLLPDLFVFYWSCRQSGDQKERHERLITSSPSSFFGGEKWQLKILNKEIKGYKNLYVTSLNPNI